MEEINIKEFLIYLKKYIWLIVLVVLVFGVGIFIYDTIFKVPVYSSNTTVVLVKNENTITTENESDTISQNDIALNQKLVSTYRQIIKSRLVLEQVISKNNLNYSYKKLYNEVDVQASEDTEILKISVTDESATVASSLANSIVEVFDTEVKKIYKIDNVSVIDKAIVPENPSNNTLIRDIVLAIMLGTVITAAIVFVVFYFDDTLRYTESLENDVEMPVIGRIYEDSSSIDLIVDARPKSSTSESIRTLRTNLQFASIDNEIKTILVTSTLPNEGKSYITANLATSFAQAGKKVLILDYDLRKGRQHKIFKVSSKNGLSNLLINDIKNFADYIEITKIENLFIIPRGVLPPNPSELISSKKNSALLEMLKKHFDVIILDGAPCNGLADSLILSSYVDKVLLVASINHTPKTELKNAKKALENVGANVAGLVANNINIKKAKYGGYYNYYYGYNDK